MINAMRKLNTLIAAIIFANSLYAQGLKVAAGGELKLFTGSGFSVNGLELMPSADFTLGNFLLEETTAPSSSVQNLHVSNVYRFTPLTASFTGSIKFNYLDLGLNGLDESQLRLHVHNGSNWQLIGTSTVDINNNYLIANNITNLALSELVLASDLVLPLKWGNVSASRKNASIKIRWSTSQEWNVSHFTIERSTDATHWSTAIANIPASNTSGISNYDHTDIPAYSGNLYYRIRQTDTDKRETVSAIVMVAAENATARLIVSPNPASTYFTLSGIDPTSISGVELFNNNGMLLKTWNTGESQYRLPALPIGTYFILVQSKDQSIVSRQLIVQ